MAKTIQVRVDDHLKDSADMLFASLGLDTSTAVRMFLVAAMQMGGIPFAVMHSSTQAERDTVIREAIARREAGERYYTIDECKAHMRAAIAEGASNAIC